MCLSILIVNYNTEEYILNFLSAIQQQTVDKSLVEIIIVNNNNNDYMDELLNRKNYSLTIRTILSENIGFGRAMNLAAGNAKYEHLLIANPDLILTQPDYLERLIIHAKEHQNYGAIATKLMNEKDEDKSEFYCYEFDQKLGYEDQICWFSGALLLIKSDIYQEIGGFDPDFFMYCEDEDICLRIKKRGLELVKINDLSITHIGGASEPNQNYDYFYRWYRSQILFAYKHSNQTEFMNLIQNFHKKAIKRIHLYKMLKYTGISRYSFKLNQWQAMHDIVEKTLKETPSWLYYTV